MSGQFTLREARERAGLGRERVAAQVLFSAKTLERYEKANAAPRYLVAKLADLYGLEVDAIRFTPKPARWMRVAA